MRRDRRHVLIVLPGDAHLIDVAGPAQVFTNAAEVTDGFYDVSFYADDGGVRSHQGLGLIAASEWPSLEPSDLVLVPGWKSTSEMGFSPEALMHVVRHFDSGGHLASVCAGSLALAHAGLLDGHHATTHHALVHELRRWPKITVEQDVLFTCEGRLHTSAGFASGIDLSLHLVSHDLGPAVAGRVARTMVVPAWRPGNASQSSVMLIHRNHMDDLVHRAQNILDDVEHNPGTLTALAARLCVAPRTLSRRFSAAVGMTPKAYLRAVRREQANNLHARGWSWETAAHAVGYADARSLRARR